MIASQMEAARIERTTIDLETADGKTGLRATGQVVLFDGYLRRLRGRPRRSTARRRGRRPRCPRSRKGADARVHAARADQHFTEPPPRYSEASLVKKLEELGIGRPSTYASILTVLRDRAYVRMEKNRFVPEDKGRLVTAFLEQFFRRYVEYDFTADLEEKLDLVSAGELDWKALLRDFWKDFHAAVGEIGELRIGQVLDALNEALGPHIFPDKGDGADPRACPTCGDGPAVAEDRPLRRLHRLLELSGVPLHPPDRASENGEDEAAAAATASWASIRPPASTIWLKAGRFGPYVEEAGETSPSAPACPRTGRRPAMDLDKALRLLRLPREVGAAPGGRQADPGRHRPLRPLRRSTTAPTPTCRTPTRCSRSA